MCRKNHLIGCALAAFGLGLLVGHWAGSPFFCVWGGAVLLAAGFCLGNRRP